MVSSFNHFFLLNDRKRFFGAIKLVHKNKFNYAEKNNIERYLSSFLKDFIAMNDDSYFIELVPIHKIIILNGFWS